MDWVGGATSAEVGGAAGARLRVEEEKRRDRRRRKQLKEIAFDFSFTSQDFKDMDLTKVNGGVSKEAEEDEDVVEEMPLPRDSSSSLKVPKLRLAKICALKRCVLHHASQEGKKMLAPETLSRLFASPDFGRCAFDLMDLNGDGILDTGEVLARAEKEDKGDDLAFRQRFGALVESFSNGYDVLTLDTFQKIWNGKELDVFMVEAIRSSSSSPEENLSLYTVMEFVILFTNTRCVCVCVCARMA